MFRCAVPDWCRDHMDDMGRDFYCPLGIGEIPVCSPGWCSWCVDDRGEVPPCGGV